MKLARSSSTTSSATRSTARRLPTFVVAFPIVISLGLLAGCAATTSTSGTTASGASSVSADANLTAAEVLAANQGVTVTSGDYDEADAANITLVQSTSLTDSDDVTISGSTITITAAGTYVLSGTLTDGHVVVNSTGDGVVRLVLDGVDITSSTTAAIAVTAADEVSLVLAADSSNSLADTSTCATDADVNAALFSAADLTISGTGALTVTGNGNDGIASKDGLVIESGAITVNAIDDGIRGKDYLVVNGGELTVTSGGDGLKADNEDDADRGFISVTAGSLTVVSSGDALQAQTDLVVTGGDLDLVSGGGSTQTLADDASAKALKGLSYVVVEGGTITANAADDAVHSNGAVHLSAGTLSLASADDGIHADTALLLDGATIDITSSYEGIESALVTIVDGEVTVTSSDDGINGSGENVDVAITGGTVVVNADGDGFDSNGTAAMTGGTLVVNGPTNSGNGALDVDGTFTVSGGTLLAAGSSGMAVTPSADSEQGFVAAVLDQSLAAGTVVQLVDADGEIVAAFESSKEFSSVVFSSSEIEDGAEYEVYVGGSVSGTVTGGLATASSLDGAAVTTTATAGEELAGMGGGGGGGDGGGMGGGPRQN